VTLPYRRDGERIEIGWSEPGTATSTAYSVTPSWRLIGTMNDSDKSSLFGLSFAFLRRFAVIDVGLPDDETYRALIAAHMPAGREHNPAELIDAAMSVAHGPIRLGPAILLDIAEFTRRGVTTTADGTPPYATASDAFLTAVRLYAAPQYDGAEHTQIAELKKALSAIFPEPPEGPWGRLTAALDRAAISAA
jgi:MoxR-like ATPase